MLKTPEKSLSKAYKKIKPTTIEIDNFKKQINEFLLRTNNEETEEHNKNILTDFLNKLYSISDNYINTSGRNDLVIHNGNDSHTSIGVIIETKRPSNSAEMPTKDNLNVKAFHELILYYLRERFNNNIEVKNLIITNNYEWYIFDSNQFEKYFYNDKSFAKNFVDFKEARLSSSSTDFFYKEIASPFVEKLKDEIDYTYFDLNDYKSHLDNNNNDKELVYLYKLLSPDNLLKLPFSNDSNTLDKKFYSELLYIIGLTEKNENSKKIIKREDNNKRKDGSLLESTIFQLDVDVDEEKLFEIALELNIIWINRILFLKLLEGQQIKYQKGNPEYSFLNKEKINGYDELNNLFFKVLAIKNDARHSVVKDKYKYVPYLNSSLFEKSEIENNYLPISQLTDADIPIYSDSVLKDNNGNKRSESLKTLDYLFEFLDAYDFSSDVTGDTQDEKKTLINASVLGLIFEKINGYKDGSFFTPGYITMYMSRETIQSAVVQKFNTVKGWNCNNLDDVYNNIDISDRKEANEIINSMKICDPAVGSGHFLVSALNELIFIKKYLKILLDKDGKILKEYDIEIENDELMITDENDDFFQYNPKSKESQRVQETIFNEKQTIIENCLFGVDINPNSVKICQLRLWIELLQYTYYTEDSNYTELETLPNIDINIKCGNSLISKYKIDADLSNIITKILPKKEKSKTKKIDNQLEIEHVQNVQNNKLEFNEFSDYLRIVEEYKNTKDKRRKNAISNIIMDIKKNINSGLLSDITDKILKWTSKIENEDIQSLAFEMSKKEKEKKENRIKKWKEDIKKEKLDVKEKREGKLYSNSFEWRFEFPEILDSNGNFIGFDCIIGNPPYIRVQGLKKNYEKETIFFEKNYKSATANYDIYVLFIEKAFNLISKSGNVCFIQPHKFLISEFGKGLREFMVDNKAVESLLHFGANMVFKDASTYTSILKLSHKNKEVKFQHILPDKINLPIDYDVVSYNNLNGEKWHLSNNKITRVFNKINKLPLTVKDVFSKIFVGIQTSSDIVYLINGIKKGNYIIGYSKALNKTIEIEIDLVKPILKSDDISRYNNLMNNHYVLFPYILNNGKAEPMSEDYIKENYPKGYQYFKDNEIILRGREKGKFDNPSDWFLYGRNQGISYVEQEKIITPDISYKSNMSYDDGKFYHGTTLYSFIKSDNVKEDYKFYLSLLNSSLMWFYIKNTSTELRGGYFRYKTKYLEPFPLPKLDNINKQIPFIEKTNQLLILNKEYQNKVSKFTNSILKKYNLEKLNKKLNSFYELSFDDFLNEIKKLTKIKTSTAKEERELFDYWEEEFEKDKAEINILKAEIDKTDSEIDKMVYELYNLTNEEIAIVEDNI